MSTAQFSVMPLALLAVCSVFSLGLVGCSSGQTTTSATVPQEGGSIGTNLADASDSEVGTDSGNDADAESDPDVLDVPSELGAGCRKNSECRSTHCVDSVCCEEACDGPCAQCGQNGRCDVVPQNDPACGETTCPDDSSCRDYETNIALGRCLGLALCASSPQCTFADLPRGALCGTSGACDGLGSCSLRRNGDSCSVAAECGSGRCLEGICGLAVAGCEQLLPGASGVVESADRLYAAWPSTNVSGAATLLDGDFGSEFVVCFDAAVLTVLYADPWNAMVRIPTANIGTHSIRLLTPAGTVSKKIEINVTSTPALGPSHSTVAGPKPVFGTPPAIFIPARVYELDPITNIWDDMYSSLKWNFNGSPPNASGGSVAFDGHTSSFVQAMEGRYDVTKHRVEVTFRQSCCDDGTTCEPSICSDGSICTNFSCENGDSCSEDSICPDESTCSLTSACDACCADGSDCSSSKLCADGSVCPLVRSCSSAASWHYVGLFSCPTNHLIDLDVIDAATNLPVGPQDICGPHIDPSAVGLAGAPRRIVFFPMTEPAPQIVMSVGEE
jgi:hypothetical protein